MHQVSYFDVSWSRREQVGSLRLTLDDRNAVQLDGLPLEEMCLLCNMLRSEKPIYYDPEGEALSTLPNRHGA